MRWGSWSGCALKTTRIQVGETAVGKSACKTVEPICGWARSPDTVEHTPRCEAATEQATDDHAAELTDFARIGVENGYVGVLLAQQAQEAGAKDEASTLDAAKVVNGEAAILRLVLVQSLAGLDVGQQHEFEIRVHVDHSVEEGDGIVG